MDKKEEEKIKKRLQNAEFNNPEEDFEITEEENVRDEFENKNKKKNIIIIGLVLLVVILIIIILLFVINGNKKNESSNNDNSSSENGNSTNNNDDKSSVINEDDYDFTSGKMYFNKYIFLASKDGKKRVITDLDFNVILNTKVSSKIYEGENKALYVINYDESNNTPIIVSYIKDGNVSEIFREGASGILLDNDTFVGLYKVNNSKDIVYLFNGNKYDTIELNHNIAYYYNTSFGEDKYIYSKRYLITYENKGNESLTNYGIYDIKTKKQLIESTYDRIEHLYDDKFVAYKNGFAGVINKDNKEFVNFDYEVITYSNGLYFLGKDDELHVYDSNFNDLNLLIPVPDVDEYNYRLCCGDYNPFDLYPFKDYVIVRVGNSINELSTYYAVLKTGFIAQLEKGNIGFVDNYFVMSHDTDTNITMYDGTLTVKHTIDVKEKAIKLDNLNIYLNNTLVINNKNLYDLTKDTSKGGTSWYRRTSQEYEVRIDFKGATGTVTVSANGEVLKTLENVSVDEFLKASNNGITITKDYFIYNAGGVIVLKREEQSSNTLTDALGLF